MLIKSNSHKTLTKSIDKKSGTFTHAKVSLDDLNANSQVFAGGKARDLPGAFGGQAGSLDINRLSKDNSIARLSNSTIKSESKKSQVQDLMNMNINDNYSDEIVVGGPRLDAHQQDAEIVPEDQEAVDGGFEGKR